MELFAPGAGIDTIAARCQISGTRLAKEGEDDAYEPGAVIPDGSWRDLTWPELHAVRGEMDLRRRVQIVQFADDASGVMADASVYGTLLGETSSKAGVLTTTEGAFGRRIGLHLDNWDGLPCSRREESRLRLCVNLGPGPRWLMVGSVDGVSICRQVAPDGPDREPHTDDVRAYVAAGAKLDVYRVRVDPGQAYVASTELLVHDGSMDAMTEPSTGAFWLGYWPEGTFRTVL